MSCEAEQRCRSCARSTADGPVKGLPAQATISRLTTATQTPLRMRENIIAIAVDSPLNVPIASAEARPVGDCGCGARFGGFSRSCVVVRRNSIRVTEAIAAAHSQKHPVAADERRAELNVNDGIIVELDRAPSQKPPVSVHGSKRADERRPPRRRPSRSRRRGR